MEELAAACGAGSSGLMEVATGDSEEPSSSTLESISTWERGVDEDSPAAASSGEDRRRAFALPVASLGEGVELGRLPR